MSRKRANRKTSNNANPPPAGPASNAPDPVLPVPAKRRRWVFRLASLILAPLLFLALLEFGLQLGGYGHAAGFFIKTDSLGEFRSNPKFGLRFFPRGLARDPVKLILNAKSPDTLRIFVLGDRQRKARQARHTVSGGSWR